MSGHRHLILLTLFCLLLNGSQVVRADDADSVHILSQIYDAKTKEQKDLLYERLRSSGEGSSESLRRIAHDTQDDKAFWALVTVAKRSDVKIADVLMERLLDPGDKFLAEYLGAGIVGIKGNAVYEELRVLATNSTPPIRDRVIRAISYSGYATEEDPVPTLVALAHALDADARKSAYEGSLFVLCQRGKRMEDQMEIRQFADYLLSWICAKDVTNLGSPHEDMGKCPYPAELRTNRPPFGLVFARISGGNDCYQLSDGAIRKVDYHSLRTTLGVELRQKGDFAVASFTFLRADQKRTSVDILFRKDGQHWKYGGYRRIATSIVCYF